jgi:tRNA nucleotidyltransferase (CCA-adding enzyme)
MVDKERVDMQCYLVGGAVRDHLIGRVVTERDWVVVGATHEQMLELGYQQVGKEFPVYLHPETKEEYALARREKKVSAGYKGFVCDFGPEVTLDEDLIRRDLTINAMAESSDGSLHDPYHGMEDIRQRMLRHISPAFSEDPVRILRVARFAARFNDFVVADETLSLMKDMVKDGEVSALVSDRVWKEFEKALQEKNPERFLEELKNCDALAVLFPYLDKHYERVYAYLKKISVLTENAVMRLAVMAKSLDELELAEFSSSYPLPKSYLDIMELVNRYADNLSGLNGADAKQVLDLFYQLDAFRRTNRFKRWLETSKLLLQIDNNSNEKESDDTIIDRLNTVVAFKVDPASLKALRGNEIADHLYEERLKVLEQYDGE